MAALFLTTLPYEVLNLIGDNFSVRDWIRLRVTCAGMRGVPLRSVLRRVLESVAGTTFKAAAVQLLATDQADEYRLLAPPQTQETSPVRKGVPYSLEPFGFRGL